MSPRLPRGTHLTGESVAIDPQDLLTKTTAQLRTLRQGYVDARKAVNRGHSTRGVMLPTDLRRCNDSIRMIDMILRSRARQHKALVEFS